MSAIPQKKSRPSPSTLPVIGWREWIGLPDFGVLAIKAKIDSGAQTSALHADSIKIFSRAGRKHVRFTLHPLQKRSDIEIECEVELLEMRKVRSSSGHLSVRPAVILEVALGGIRWPIEVTLVNRDVMGFRMLLGRQAIRKRFLIDCGRSYLVGKAPSELEA